MSKSVFTDEKYDTVASFEFQVLTFLLLNVAFIQVNYYLLLIYTSPSIKIELRD